MKPGPNLGRSKDWIEPLIGARFARHFNDNLGIGFAADPSGFGVGSASDVIADFSLAAEDRFNEKWLPSFGCQISSYDDSNGSGADEFGVHATFQGLWLGAAIGSWDHLFVLHYKIDAAS